MRLKLGSGAINRWVIHTELCMRARQDCEVGSTGFETPRVHDVSPHTAA
jgi:hypothetical protein